MEKQSPPCTLAAAPESLLCGQHQIAPVQVCLCSGGNEEILSGLFVLDILVFFHSVFLHSYCFLSLYRSVPCHSLLSYTDCTHTVETLAPQIMTSPIVLG